MIKSFYLFALLCVLSLSNAQSFLPLNEYENEEANWENEECSWEEENELNDWDLDLDNGLVGKVTADADVATGSSAEDIGAAVKDGIVKVGDAIAASEQNTNVIPSTGNQNTDQVIAGIVDAIKGLGDNVNTGANQVGTEVGNVVTNSVNAVQQTPDDVSGAVGGAVSQSVTDLGNRADDIGNQIGGAVGDALDQIIQNVPNAQNNELISSLNEARNQISGAVSSIVTTTASHADAIGGAIGNSIGDAVDEGKGTADTWGDAVANLDQTVKDNANSIGDAAADGLATVMGQDPTVTQEQIDNARDEVSQNVAVSLKSTTQGDIDADRNAVKQAVNNAINAAQSQGNNNAVGVINALADQGVALVQNAGNQ